MNEFRKVVADTTENKEEAILYFLKEHGLSITYEEYQEGVKEVFIRAHHEKNNGSAPPLSDSELDSVVGGANCSSYNLCIEFCADSTFCTSYTA